MIWLRLASPRLVMYKSLLSFSLVSQEPLVHKVEYVSIGRKDTMEELDRVDRNGAIISVALRLGNVRLIDNLFL